MFRSFLVLTIVSLAAAQVIQAQQDTTGLTAGRRIRVHQPGMKNVTGTFAFMDTEHLALVTTPGDTVTLSRDGITGLDLSIGTKSNRGKGAVKGLLIGGILGVVVGVALGVAAQDSYADAGVPAYAAATGILFAGIGAGIGALASSGAQTDRWAKATWPIVAFGPGVSGAREVAIGMHLTF
jgi:hypothetical protein